MVKINGPLMYVNGVEDSASYSGSGTPTSIFSSPNDDLIIGQRRYLPYSPGQWFKGSIDEVRIFNRALLAPEIKKLYSIFG